MRVHHIEFLCKDLELQVQRFCLLYGFRVYGRWRDVILQQKEKVVLKKDRIYFVLHEDAKAECDYVDNIALEARKLSELCELIPKENILVKPAPVDCTISSQFEKQSSIKGAVIRSPVGRVKHTLVDKSNYRGLFLPNFTLHQYSEEDNLFQENKSCEIIDGLFSLSHEVVDLKSCSNDTLMLDHITFAVNSGTSFDLIKWYTDFLHMERCKVNNNEQADGFKVETLNSDGKQLGLRLTAMQYHFCSEISMKITSPGGNGIENPKIVFAESLLGQGPNQVDTFLKENSGPGVQHIGLLSGNIFSSVKQWISNGVEFINPPIHYYNEIDEKIKKLDEENLRQLLEEHGVLLDTEEIEDETEFPKYLLQVFTKPVFLKETFFFELIQRHGASGFGAGNISALWRAVDAYLREGNKFKE